MKCPMPQAHQAVLLPSFGWRCSGVAVPILQARDFLPKARRRCCAQAQPGVDQIHCHRPLPLALFELCILWYWNKPAKPS